MSTVTAAGPPASVHRRPLDAAVELELGFTGLGVSDDRLEGASRIALEIARLRRAGHDAEHELVLDEKRPDRADAG